MLVLMWCIFLYLKHLSLLTDLHSHIAVPSLSVIVLLMNVGVLMLKRQSLPLLVIQILFQSILLLQSHLILRLTYLLLIVKIKHITSNRRHIYNFLSYHRFPPPHYVFVSIISAISVPKFV